ncbi:MAG: serine O-acetyltransferase [Candidatus Bipolaricaulaceae bacterium]
MFSGLREDLRAVLARDPAARNRLEVLLCYPGMHALWGHRIAHWLWNRRLRLTARLFAHLVRRRTGVEIHPGARIGRRVTIDHGCGVVIGETAEVGDDVHLYSGVVLGATSRRPGKRHPTVEAGAVLGAGAVLLGPIRVGRGVRVGAGTVVRTDVPPGATVLPPVPTVASRSPADLPLPAARRGAVLRPAAPRPAAGAADGHEGRAHCDLPGV